MNNKLKYKKLRDAQGNVMAVYEKKRHNNGNEELALQEQHIYGSSRLGMRLPNGDKNYELTNHLGNVLAVISDTKNADGTAKVVSASDYYPFGMQMPARSLQSEGYRYGFGGHEKDDEVSGNGNHLSFGDYGYDTRLGRRFGLDPIIKPDMSDYSAFNNNPIYFVDISGKNGIAYETQDKKGKKLVIVKANYYYAEATEAQKSTMNKVKKELSYTKKIKDKNGEKIQFRIDVDFIQSVDPKSDANKDKTSNGNSYGNTLTFTHNEGADNELGIAGNDMVKVFVDKIENVSNKYETQNRESSNNTISADVLTEEVLHNLGGLHQDKGALPQIRPYSYGRKDVLTPEQPAQNTPYTTNNAQKIFDRIGGGYDQNKNDKTRDKDGNVGKVEYDENK